MSEQVVQRYCPCCKRGTWHTIHEQAPWTFYTCRGGCGHPAHKVAYR